MDAVATPKLEIPRCIPLEAIGDEACGGKAEGLAKLIGLGLSVPPGFVLLGAGVEDCADEQSSELGEMLAEQYRAMGGGKVAVRSSAIGEDSEDASFAGQFDTLLNIEGETALMAAVRQCLDSVNAEHVRAYQAEHHNGEPMPMCVVVQRMVDAEYAGVLFTADPVTARRDVCVIDAVAGLGEALVSGDVTPDHYELNASGECCYQELVGEQPLLTGAQLRLLLFQALDAQSRMGQPLDMEWAIDRDGSLYWVQARPITTLPADLNELDTGCGSEDVLTRCNVGEMMPGAVSPLTFAVTGRGIEWGMQHMHTSYAGRPAITDEWTQISQFYGQLFINMTGGAEAQRTVLGVDVEAMGHSVCGRLVPELKGPEPANILRRLWGAIRLARYVFSADKVIARHDKKVESFQLRDCDSSSELMAELDQKLPMAFVSMAVHLQSSSTSGFTGSILQRMVAGGDDTRPEDEAEVARLLAGARGVESAVLVEQLDGVCQAIAVHGEGQVAFESAEPDAALAWLQSTTAEPAASLFKAFLARHGHRSYRELDVRQPCWEDAPLPLISTMQSSVTGFRSGESGTVQPPGIDLSALDRGLRWIVPKAHKAVRRREGTKSMLVYVTNVLKRGYRRLGEVLAAEGHLPDADLVFFFTHEELKTFVAAPNPDEVARAEQRREALSYQNQLEFAEISVGAPKPLDMRAEVQETEGQLSGRPVSRGVIEGVVRVARDLDEAKAIQPGEILIAPITDVGWTPYFNFIAGLVTDVGSAVSHGAVIAREYGLPCIVNTRMATKVFVTGDRVRLDADKGVIEKLD